MPTRFARMDPRVNLVDDALSILDLLESQSHASPDPTQAQPFRRDQLAQLLSQVDQHEGARWSRQDMLRAIDKHLECHPAALIGPRAKHSGEKWPALARALGCLTSQGRRLVQWWRQAPVVRFWVLGCSGCVAGAAALAFTPWMAVLRAPFVLAATHGALYSMLLLTVMGLAVLVGIRADQTSRVHLQVGAGVTLGLSVLIGAFGGGLAYMNAHDTQSLNSLMYGVELSEAALVEARDRLPSSAPLEVVVAKAKVSAMGGHFNRANQALMFKADLNPTECQALNTRLPSGFHVASVNGAPVSKGLLACPFVWDNTVVIASKPGIF